MSGEITFAAKNGSSVLLREAVPADAGELVDAVRSAADERSLVMSEKRSRKENDEAAYITALNRDKNLLLVAVIEGRVIGGLAVLQADEGKREKTAQICHVGLHIVREYREQRIGLRMLQYAVDWVRQKDYKKIEASIFTLNKRSLGLFKKFGFIEDKNCLKQFRIGSEYIEEVCMSLMP